MKKYLINTTGISLITIILFSAQVLTSAEVTGTAKKTEITKTSATKKKTKAEKSVSANKKKSTDQKKSKNKKTDKKKIKGKPAGNKNPGKKPVKKKPAKKKLTEKQMKSEKKRADKIERTLDYGIQKERKIAITYILKIKSEELRKKLALKLVELIKHEPDSSTKTKAITTITELKERSAIPVLTDLLDDETEDVRVAATYALKKLNGISAKEKLIKIFKAQDLTVDNNFNEALITTLGEFKAAELVSYVKEQIESYKTTKICRQALVLFLGKTGSKEAGDFLIKLFENDEEDLNIRAFAVNSIAKLQLKESADVIKKMLKEIDSYTFKKKKRYYSLYIYSVAALVKLGDNEAVPRLMASLKSNNAGVRLKSIKLLRELKDKRTIDILKYKMKYDPDTRVQKEAKLALKDMGIETEKKKEDEKKEDKKETSKKKKIKKTKKDPVKKNKKQPEKVKKENKKTRKNKKNTKAEGTTKK